MTTWSDRERLALIAVLLKRKRDEVMGTAPPTTLNHETLLVLAVAPADVCEEIAREIEAMAPTEEIERANYTALVGALKAMEVADETRTALWWSVVADMRRTFQPAMWPRWLPKFGDR